MDFPLDQVEELMLIVPDAHQHNEGGYTFFSLPNLQLPASCVPSTVDALLCPMPRDGYTSRLYFANRITTQTDRNWNGQPSYILGRLWYAFSWQIDIVPLRLAQIFAEHIGALR